MKPAPFDYYAPETLEQAVALLEKLEDDDIDAKILAGGQSLMPMLSLRMARPEALVDLGRISTLDYIREEDGVIKIGAMTSKSALEDCELVQQKQPLLHAATCHIGHRQIRNQGTVGGSFAHADPAAEYGAIAQALGMEMVIVGPEGERVIPADDFYVTFLTTDLDSTEILTEVRAPVLAPATGWAFQEICRREGDLAIAGAAVTLRVEAGLCADVVIAVFGVNSTAARLEDAEQVVNGQVPAAALFAQAGEAAAASLAEPISDVHASGEYRRDLIATLVKRCLAEAVERAA
ncbi:xanthine dehydrogenase family protein subunit M [Seongchinamella sediminis]|uniref:Xanthine dehydrogenase family protein subunit M n=1 Tax=Seongchinamella sediminis TaxID=2283635 RepID=A0A3L7DUK8_9GAMM|nr:xanthine dehydrogenase family protein subunit M [Seongchinamella sediminis]RLQ21074.1 xanthine dehydrogenase family protein subunit M [Seongchinamella sediminis]